MSYQLEGRLLEVCTCNTLCPCWVGEDPDGGTCTGVLGWHVDKGSVNGLDVSGRSLVILTYIPGNILKGNWRVLGGPVADLAKLVGQIDAVEQVPITFEVQGVNGSLRVGNAITADLTPFQGATGKPTALHDTVFTTIPGSPAYVGKASKYTAKAPGFDVDLRDHNAVSGSFRFQA